MCQKRKYFTTSVFYKFWLHTKHLLNVVTIKLITLVSCGGSEEQSKDLSILIGCSKFLFLYKLPWVICTPCTEVWYEVVSMSKNWLLDYLGMLHFCTDSLNLHYLSILNCMTKSMTCEGISHSSLHNTLSVKQEAGGRRQETENSLNWPLPRLSGLHTEFQTSQTYIVRLCLKKFKKIFILFVGRYPERPERALDPRQLELQFPWHGAGNGTPVLWKSTKCS